MILSDYSPGAYTAGRSLPVQLGWWFVGAALVRSSYLPFSGLKVFVLRLFGAKLGKGVRVKPGVHIKFPWRLRVGDHSWIGERVWIDNLSEVSIGSHTCVSQGVYLCTGNHRWDTPDFSLDAKPIEIGNHVWLAAGSAVGPGVRVGDGAVLTLGSVAAKSLDPWSIYSGNPIRRVGARARP